MKNTYSFFLLLMLSLHINAQDSDFKITLKVLDESSGLPIENTQISITPCSCGGVTNAEGYFTVSLVQDTYTVKVSYVGYRNFAKKAVLNDDLMWVVKLSEEEERLSEVIVRAKRKNDNIESPQMGTIQFKANELKKMPTALGEFDVLRSINLVAGVNNAGDLSNGLSVRGSSLDQNLILYENAPIFNPTHLFGLVSVFTPDVLSSVDLYKANIPSRYGGRVSSVIDIKVRNPYIEKFKMTGGVGLLSSRLSIETPVVKDKLMMEFGVRGGFTDFLLPIFSKRLKNTKARFADGTLKVLYLPAENDQITFTGFYSKDFYQLDLVSQVENVVSNSNEYDFGILNGTLKWLHFFDNNLNLQTTLVGSNYTPKIIFPEIDVDNELEYKSRIKYASLTSEISKKSSDELEYYTGVQVNQYKVDPGSLNPGSATSVLPVSLAMETSYELSGYANVNWKAMSNMNISAGLRYNQYMLVGPYSVANFNEVDGSLDDIESFEKGKTVKAYGGLEPRLGVSYSLGQNTSLKASYARINQYLQNIYNNTTPLPTSRWKTSDAKIKPQIGDTYGIGLYRNFDNDNIQTSFEGYYRDAQNVLTYKPGADFFLEEFIEQDVVQGEGKAYGIEFSLSKPKGKINGWFNYTWSRSLVRSNNEKIKDRINNNKWFASDFDRPHVVNATINFEGNSFNRLSLNFTGQTGRPYTVANAAVSLDEINVPIFLERNNARLPVYHRLDLSWNVHFSESKKNKRWQNDWTFTVYNLYGRKNPTNIYYEQRVGASNSDIFLDSPLGAYQLLVLNSPLFSLSYNFKFQ